MKINYSLSAIMKMGHKIASSVRQSSDTYKAALSTGLKKAWKVAKGLLPHVEVESIAVINEDIQLRWAHQCLGNVEGNACRL